MFMGKLTSVFSQNNWDELKEWYVPQAETEFNP
jgi:hypothetical protein